MLRLSWRCPGWTMAISELINTWHSYSFMEKSTWTPGYMMWLESKCGPWQEPWLGVIRERSQRVDGASSLKSLEKWLNLHSSGQVRYWMILSHTICQGQLKVRNDALISKLCTSTVSLWLKHGRFVIHGLSRNLWLLTIFRTRSKSLDNNSTTDWSVPPSFSSVLVCLDSG